MIDDPLISATITAFFGLFFLLNAIDQLEKDRKVMAIGALLLFGLSCGILMLDAKQAINPCTNHDTGEDAK